MAPNTNNSSNSSNSSNNDIEGSTPKNQIQNPNSKPNPKPKSKCCAEGCTQRPAIIIGDCAYCESRFCAQHRLPEMHECVKLKQCRQIAKTENTQRLNSQALSSVMKVGY